MDLQTIARGKTIYLLRTVQADAPLVRSVQTGLNKLGFSAGPVDGVWTRDTDSAFKAFAKRYRLDPTGVSPQAANALLGAIATPTPSPSPVATAAPASTAAATPAARAASYGSVSAVSSLSLQTVARGRETYPLSTVRSYRSLVQSIQTALNRMGFSAGTADGNWGSRTDTAYRAFSLRYGFRATELAPRAANLLLSSAGEPSSPSPAPSPRPSPSPSPRPNPSPSPGPTGNFFNEALRFTLRWEGGFSDHPNDYGGATNKGIIQTVYDDYRRRQGLPLRSVRFITDDEVNEIYETQYWRASQASLMVRTLAIAHFDTAVNFGVRGATLFLQEALGVSADGVFGAGTRAALERANTSATARRYVDRRIEYRYERVAADPSQRVFLQGWLNRDNDLKRYISSIS